MCGSCLQANVSGSIIRGCMKIIMQKKMGEVRIGLFRMAIVSNSGQTSHLLLYMCSSVNTVQFNVLLSSVLSYKASCLAFEGIKAAISIKSDI